MARSNIYEPKQKRSIEKKNHIIETGIELMTEKGYHHTTTDDIAAAAGVSTGIIYRYFKDKHDILIDGLRFYFKKMNRNSIFLSKQQIRTISGFLPKICLRGFWRSISITGICMKNLRLCATATAKWLPYTIKQRLRSSRRSPL